MSGGWHVTQPIQHKFNTLHVIFYNVMTYSVWTHDFRTTQLVVTGVYILSQKFIQRTKSGENNGTILNLES